MKPRTRNTPLNGLAVLVRQSKTQDPGLCVRFESNGTQIDVLRTRNVIIARPMASNSLRRVTRKVYRAIVKYPDKTMYRTSVHYSIEDLFTELQIVVKGQ